MPTNYSTITCAARRGTFGVTDRFPGSDGQTPLTADDRLGLIPGHVQTRGELDEFEAANIAAALAWLARRRRADPLDIGFMRELHRRMLGRVWTWAGNFSKAYDRTLGVDANQIEPELRKLIGDGRYWIGNETYDDATELLANFHHRLTVIYPFPNGNGRWARLMTDELVRFIDASRIAWGGAAGQGMLQKVDTDARGDYVAALRAADGFDLGPLTALIRSYSFQ